MFNALKNLSKGTLILIGTVIFLPIFIIILLVILQSCSTGTSYDKYESKMITAASKYFNDKKLLPESNTDSTLVTLDALVSGGYIKSPEKLFKDKNCEGYVSVRNNGYVKELDLSGKPNYNVYLKCDNYKTNTLKDNIMNDLVTSGSGLYEDGNYYVFKGDNPKNVINFYGKLYRILSIDKDGVARLVKAENEMSTRPWDNKYNVEANYSYGKSIFKDSYILKILLADYSNDKIISKKAREHIVSHDICIGKRDKDDKSISFDLDCSDVLNEQVISLVNVSDFARASLDPDCNSIDGRSCRNYNYLYEVLNNTWTLNSASNNSYEVFYLSSGVAQVATASDYNEYNIIIYIDGDETVKSGNGTINDPYIINNN